MNRTDPDESLREENADELAQGVLPPMTEKRGSENHPPPTPPEGISPTLKRTIILFTVFTLLAFAAFGAIFIKKLMGNQQEKQAVWDEEVLTVAERLRDAGLYDQALRQYERYLENPDLDFENRAKVAYTAASLYLQLDNCAEGLVWLYQAQTAFPEAPWATELNGKIDACLTRLKAPR